MRQATLARGRLAEHPVWSRVLARPDLAGRVILPVIVGSAVEDREKVEAAPWLERLSLTEVVREARAAASAGLAGLLLFGISDRKDEHAMLASEPDHVVPRAIRAVKEAVPELGVATDVCVCAYTAHGQCVLFGEHGADVAATLERLAAIAEVHADAGADLLIPSGLLEGTVPTLRDALGPRRARLSSTSSPPSPHSPTDRSSRTSRSTSTHRSLPRPRDPSIRPPPSANISPPRDARVPASLSPQVPGASPSHEQDGPLSLAARLGLYTMLAGLVVASFTVTPTRRAQVSATPTMDDGPAA